jgi:hypothetical protein
MSKVSKAKETQNYRKQPNCCQHCKHFSAEMTETKYEWSSYIHTTQKNLRCTVGGFAVQKMAVCDKFEIKE